MPITDPFADLKMVPREVLNDHKKRVTCPDCGRSSQFYCPKCRTSLLPPDTVPQIHLPIPLDIVMHPGEKVAKATGIHASVVAPQDVRVLVTSVDELPKWNPKRTMVLFPAPDAVDLADVDLESYDRLVVIDCTWNQTHNVLLNPELQGLTKVKIRELETRFWRFQQLGLSYLATIEAIWSFYRQYVDVRNARLKDKGEPVEEETNYNSVDNLQFFFANQWHLIQETYRAKERQTFCRRHRLADTYIQRDDSADAKGKDKDTAGDPAPDADKRKTEEDTDAEKEEEEEEK